MEFLLTDIEGNRFTVQKMPSNLPAGDNIRVIVSFAQQYFVSKQEWNDFLNKFREYQRKNNVKPFPRR
jgi:hypothetical protein